MNVHELVDQFVACDDSPESNFQRIENAVWILDLESQLPKRLPVSFRSLVTRCSFSAFDQDALSFFSNVGDGSDEELSVARLSDRVIADATLRASYIQCARPVGKSYDPICFDANRASNNREFPIVRLDHEEILCHGKIL